MDKQIIVHSTNHILEAINKIYGKFSYYLIANFNTYISFLPMDLKGLSAVKKLGFFANDKYTQK